MLRSPASLPDTRRFIAAVARAQGRLPEPIRALLAAADLLVAPRAVHDPTAAIVDELVSGKADAEKVEELIAAAAAQSAIDNFRGEVSRRSEPVLIQKVHKAFADGCTDELLDSMRDRFTKAAEQIETARGLIPAEQPVEQFLATASPKAVAAWQALPQAVATTEQIAGIAAAFGTKPTALYPLLEPFALGEGRLIDDRALWAVDGNNLAEDSQHFGRPDTGHRSSPWFKTAPLRLHTVASATERYRRWCEGEWIKLHSGPRDMVLGRDGQYRPLPLPPNPYAVKELAR